MTVMADDTALDLDLLRVVRRIRNDKGACTVRQVAIELGMSTMGAQHRIDRALHAGHLERSDVAGSIRIAVAAGNLLDASLAGSGEVVELVVTNDGEVLDCRIS